MAVENKTPPPALRGAGPEEVIAPLRKEIVEVLRERMTLLVNWCPGAYDIDTPAKHLSEIIIEMFKRHIEAKRRQVLEVLELLAQDVYLSGCYMAIDKGQYVNKIIEVLLNGL